jgi:pilus assembly protein Flp/PilA
MKNYKQILSNLMNDESGQDLIEYALIAGIIALGATATLSTVATDIGSIWTSIGTKLTAAV